MCAIVCAYNSKAILMLWKSLPSLIAKLWLVTFQLSNLHLHLNIERHISKSDKGTEMLPAVWCFTLLLTMEPLFVPKIVLQFIIQNWNPLCHLDHKSFLVTLEENKKAVRSTLVIVKQRWNVRHATWKHCGLGRIYLSSIHLLAIVCLQTSNNLPYMYDA